ncbi:MAG: hypothetical protein NC180_02065 [Muribaculaceae bacterium]|nr:hypothetical protein [Roseburia sp.]MCM1432234.1 hypothetical protein [Muribaculaceae bacterium]MCM1491989.1 hypothetical protein [Muribaculaceae bacterium]
MYDQPYDPWQYSDKRSQSMELTSLILGVAAVTGCACLYLALPCGALAVILALLSRGGSMELGQKAQVGLILGIFALVLTIVLYGVSFGVALYQYGSMENILKAYSEMSGMDYDELLQQLYPAR